MVIERKNLCKRGFLVEKVSIHKGFLYNTKDLRPKNKVANVVHDRLIVYEKERGNIISKAQGDP